MAQGSVIWGSAASSSMRKPFSRRKDARASLGSSGLMRGSICSNGGVSVAAMGVMARGAEVVAKKLFEQGEFAGIIGMGGSAGTAIVTAAMRSLPLGVPKVCVSTVASGNTAPYVGAKDVVLFPSIVDVAGINRISRIIYSRAAGAICGMVEGEAQRHEGTEVRSNRAIIAASMYGNTTECVNACREALTRAGDEVMVVNAAGVGGRTRSFMMEGALDESYIA